MSPRTILLLGVGHTHAEIVRRWIRQPRTNTRLICVSDHPRAAYSGMLPGALAGHYDERRMTIDLPGLCAAAGAELHVAPARNVDVERRRVELETGVELPFDVLSIGIGSRPRFDQAERNSASGLVEIKPMQSFLDRLDKRLTDCRPRSPREQVSVVVVGGGAAGAEITCCLPARLTRQLGRDRFQLTLVEGGPTLVPGFPPRARRLLQRRLRAADIKVRLDERVVELDERGLRTASGEHLPADVVVWTTGAAGPSLLRRLPLERDERGFLLADATLQVDKTLPIFAVGDTVTLRHQPTPKAGVYAVRHAPILWDNLHRFLDGHPLRTFEPQRDFLKLLNTGEGKALLAYRRWSFHARWCWWLKDAIDRRFIGKYQAAAKGER